MRVNLSENKNVREGGKYVTMWNHSVQSKTLFYSLQETYEAKRKEFLGDLQKKEEEMRQMFVNKVKETESELKEKEREVSPASFRIYPSQKPAWQRNQVNMARETVQVQTNGRALSSVTWEVWAAQAHAPGGEEKGGGEETGSGGGDERLQQEEGGGWDAVALTAS